MGRPSKHSDVPDARERIISAFWSLIPQHRINEMTVGMIVAEAGCNRNTFYYHFENKEALVNSVIEGELEDTARRVFSMVAGFSDGYLERMLDDRYMGKIALIMKQGNSELIQRKVKEHVIGVWQAVLRPEGDALSDKTRCVIECVSGSTLSLISYLGNESLAGRNKQPPLEFLHSVSHNAVSYICAYENVSRDEVLLRLRMLERYSKMPQA